MRNIRRRLMAENAARRIWMDTPIRFEDAEVKRICVENFGGESGITAATYGTVGVRGVAGELTPRQAAAVRSVGALFKGNTLVNDLRALRLFGIKSMDINTFNGCSALKQVAIPGSCTLIGIYLFGGISSVPIIRPERVSVSEGVTDIPGGFDNFISGLVVYPSTTRKFGWRLPIRNAAATVLKAQVPPSLNAVSTDGGNPVYVPDESVDSYKGAAGWSSIAQYIRPISEYEGDLDI